MAGQLRRRHRREPVVLLTGFEPFGSIALNPSEAIARALNGRRIAGARIVGCVLPVALARINDAVRTALRDTRPDLVLALGVARATHAIRIERRAMNRADFEIADNDGTQVAGALLDPAGPASRITRLPLKHLARAIGRARIGVRHSTDAGAYLCNAGYFAFLGTSTPCVFLHLPPVSAMPLRAQRRAVEAALEELVSSSGARGPSG